MTTSPHSSANPALVSFSGMDGAGKSTQISRLVAHLEGRGLRVHIVTFWDDVATLKQVREVSGHKLFGGDKGVGSPDKPINRRDKNVRAWPMTVIRLGIYLSDALSLRRVVKRALRSGADVVICDRYAWDELANLSLGNPFLRIYARLIAKLVPRPAVSYILDADPVLARARKPEYPLDFLYTCRESYKALSRLLPGLSVVAPGTVDEVHREIVRLFDSAGDSRDNLSRQTPADMRATAN